MVRHKILWSLTLAVALATLACGGENGPDLGPPDPESLVLAALLTEDDLPDGDWQENNRSFDELYPEPAPSATAFPLPEELRGCGFESSLEASVIPPHVETAHTRTFFRLNSSDESDGLVMVTVEIYATRVAAQEAAEQAGELDSPFGSGPELSDECAHALAQLIADVSDGSAVMTFRERDPGFDLRGITLTQGKQTISSSAGVTTSVITTARFARGYARITYAASEENDNTIDHERLIRRLIERATEAQSSE